MRLRYCPALFAALFLFPALLDAQEAESYPVPSAEIFAYDRHLPLDAKLEVEKESEIWIAYRVTYKSVWGNEGVASFVLPRAKTSSEFPCVMLLHGHPGSRRDYRPQWKTFVSLGYALFIPDAWGHGERARDSQTEYFGRYPYQTRNMLIQSVVDYRRGIDFLQSRPEIDGDRIGLLGVSMGGILGSLLSGSDERVKAPIIVVAGGNWKKMYSTSTLPEVVAARKTLSPKEIELGFQAMDPVDPMHWIGRISPRPVLLINGDRDKVVPVVGNKILHGAAKEPKTIVWYKGGHLPIGSEAILVRSTIISWLNKHLKKSSE